MNMMNKRITWLVLGLIAALGVTVAAAPPLNLMPVYLWLGADKVSASNPLPVSGPGATAEDPAYVIPVITASNPAASNIAVAATGFTTLIDIDSGTQGAYNLICWLHVDADGSNVDDVDGIKVYVLPSGVTIGAKTPVALGGMSGTTATDFTNPNPELVNFIRTTDEDANLVSLDEDDEALMSLKIPASSQVRIDVSLNNDGAVDALCTQN